MQTWTLLVTMLALSIVAYPFAQANAGRTVQCTLKITGMTCGGCEGAVKLAAKRVDGVKSVTASAKSGTADVTYDTAKTSPEAIAKAVTKGSGFKAEVLKS